MKIDLNTLIEKFNQWDIKLRALVFGAILLLIFLIDAITLISFQWSSLQKMEDTNQTLKTNIVKLKVDLQRRDQMNRGLANSRVQLEAMSIKIHSTQEISAVLAEISQIANETKLTIDRLIPQPQAQQELISTPDIKYYTLPIVLDTNSGYHTLGHFLNQLESDKVLFTLRSLDIQSQENDKDHLSIRLTLGVILSETTKKTDGHKT